MNVSPITRILLRLPNWLGDSVMISPAFEWLKRIYPQAHFTLVGTQASCGIYQRDAKVKRIIIDTSKTQKHRIRAILSLAREVGKHDLAISFSNTFLSALLLFLTRTPIRIGYARECRSLLLTHAIPLRKSPPKSIQEHNQKYHQVLLYLFLLTPLPQIQALIYSTMPLRQIQNFKPQVLDSETSHHLVNFLRSEPLHLIAKPLNPINPPKPNQSSKPRIGINPGAAFGSAKCWEKEYFIVVIEYFLARSYPIYLFGSSTESQTNTTIALAFATHPNAHYFHDLTDKTTLPQLVDSIASMNVFLTNDSGPMHIAAALQIPLVAIFGPTDINETAPYTQSTQILLHKDISCSPCKKRECPLKHRECMKAITPEEVITQIQRVLKI